jgi:hypothetical protein
MAVCDILDLCLEAEVDPLNPEVVLIRETETPDVVVETPLKNFRAFREAVKEGKYDDI